MLASCVFPGQPCGFGVHSGRCGLKGILDEVEAVAIKRVIAWQLSEAMRKGGITKKAMAERLKTSRS